ncbi:MAG: TonB-dependent receptor [Xanthomonadaceae bacterium]|nr:TonB-dependent receptor [Xanthomonadaceae bacterium]
MKCWVAAVLFVSLLNDSSVLAEEPTEPSTASKKEDYLLPEISVFGQSWGKSSVNEFVPTISDLSGRKLERRKQNTLGETLSREAGVSSSFFGPNASRPVIRGLDGERIRILQNGVGTLDASGTSPDHAVSADPFLMEKVEIIRGSASLLYGSSAIGGVVNMVNGRIPEKLTDSPDLRINSQFSSVDLGRNGGFIYNTKAGNFALHFDGVLRGSNDYKIPGFARSAALRASSPLTPEPYGEVANSSNRAWEGALGGSYVFDSGFAGASFSSFDTLYGTVAEPDVKIDLKRQRLDLGSEIKGAGFIQSARIKAAYSYYKHEELENGTVGTTFMNRGAEARVDLKHKSLGAFEGIIGAQGQYFDFSASGAEAFLPTTLNTSVAVFGYEELKLGRWTPSFGARIERSQVTAQSSSNFGPESSRYFVPLSASIGTLYQLSTDYSLGLNTTFSQRAPNYQELYANGPHIGTGIFEVGDREIGIENGRAAELSLREKTKQSEGRVSVYIQDFQNFIALLPTGSSDAGSGLDIYNYRSVEARLYGAELEYRHELPWKVGAGFFEVEAKVDFVRGLNISTSQNLPRITPIRETIGIDYNTNFLRTGIELQHSERQAMTAPGELPTEGYYLVNLALEAPINTSFGVLQAKLRVNNLLNEEARTHVSFLKDRAPLPGRNIVLGIQANI